MNNTFNHPPLSRLRGDEQIVVGALLSGRRQPRTIPLSLMSQFVETNALADGTSAGDVRVWDGSAWVTRKLAYSELTGTPKSLPTDATDGQYAAWDDGAQEWVAVDPPAGGGEPGGADGQIQFNDSGEFGGIAGSVWDAANGWLGLGAAPTGKLHIESAVSGETLLRILGTGTTNARVFDMDSATTGPSDIFNVQNDALVVQGHGAVSIGTKTSSMSYPGTLDIFSGGAGPELRLRAASGTGPTATMRLKGGRNNDTTSAIAQIYFEDFNEANPLARMRMVKQSGGTEEGVLIFDTNDGAGSLIEALRIDRDGDLTLSRRTSTTTRQQVSLRSSFPVSTDATRQARGTLSAYDYNAEREAMRFEADGTEAKIGFLGADAAPRQAHIADVPTEGSATAADNAAAINSILSVLEAFGFTATS